MLQLTYYVVTCFLAVLYYLDFFEIATHQYRRFRQLNHLVSSQYKNIGMIVWISFGLIFKSMYVTFIQKLNKNLKKIDKNTYELSYIINGQLYKLIVKQRKGPKNVIQVIDEEDNDLTENMLSYLGPHENFHGNKDITPFYFGKKKLVFFLSNGDEVIFDTHTKIDFYIKNINNNQQIDL